MAQDASNRITTEKANAFRKSRLIPLLSAIGGALLILRAVIPAEAAPTPCDGISGAIASGSAAKMHCVTTAKSGL